MSKSKIKITLRNKTDFEVIFVIGERSYTIGSEQSTKITVDKQTSIEARPRILGVESSFIAGGLKHNAILECTLERDNIGNKHRLLLLPV